MRCLLVAGFVLPVAAHRISAQTVAHLNLVLALDVSASVNDSEFELQRKGIALALRDAAVQAAILQAPGGVNIAMVQWASIRHQRVALDWRHLSDKGDIDALADDAAAMPRALEGGGTMIHGGLEFAATMLGDAPMPAARQVIDLSGNGAADDVAALDAVRDRLVTQGIVINGLAIEEDPPYGVTEHFRGHLIGGPGAFVITAQDFPDFARAMRLKFLREIGISVASL